MSNLSRFRRPLYGLAAGAKSCPRLIKQSEAHALRSLITLSRVCDRRLAAFLGKTGGRYVNYLQNNSFVEGSYFCG